MVSTDMDDAPRDRRILVLTEVRLYREGRWGHNWETAGHKWIEAWWREADGGWPEGFAAWCGNPRTRSTDRLRPVAWAECPPPPPVAI